ncbi:MAG: hypothetical protein OEM60_07610 [Gammaproteobacteria bacterium]|nr:hypothetical protein [Gammaproteobacteria bacterium]MDH3433707.1 hypothetical protein [Gammaproteobacteria bacterium]
MTPKSLITLIALSLLMSLPIIASAQSGRDKEKPVADREISTAQNRARTQETIDELSAEQREELEEEVRARRDRDPDGLDDADDDADDDGKSAAQLDRNKGKTKAAGQEMKARGDLQREGAEAQGSERAQEMRARRDERKAIKDDYRSGREAGDEADVAAHADDRPGELDDPERSDAAIDAAEAKDKPKKPWWKFWDD